MSETTPAKAKSRLWSRLAILATFAIVGYVGWRWATSESGYVAKAELWVTKRMAPVPVPKDDSRGGVVDDFASMHMVLLKSPYIIERAVEKGNLKNLKSLEDAPDPVTAIQGMLRVSRNETAGGPGAPILMIECRGPDGKDCEKIVEAVVDSYRAFLHMTYRNVSEDTIKFFQKARDSLYADLKDAEMRYARFRTERAAALSRFDSRDEIRKLDQKLLENSLREQDLKVQIEQTQGGRNTIPVQIKVREWAKASGFDALPEQVREETTATDAYIESLRAELANARNLEASVKQLKDAKLGEMKDALTFTFEDDKLKNEVSRIQQMFDTTLQKLTEIDLVRDQSGFDARLLSPPKAVKARWW
jgi:uncharacterized protein involved in exopolysaccharide biosynthesis